MNNRKIVKYFLIFFTVCLMTGVVYQVYQDTNPEKSISPELRESLENSLEYEKSRQPVYKASCDKGNKQSCELLHLSTDEIKRLEEKLK